MTTPHANAWIKRAGLALVVVALASVTLAACGSSSGSSTTTITLYNGQHVQTTDALVTAFEKEYPNISVAVRSNDEDTLVTQIVQEGSRSPADVIYTENSPALEYLQHKGLLSKVDAATLAKTPSQYNSPQGDWVGVSARVSVLIYNPSLIKKSALPTSVLQLANPKYRGELAFARGRDRLPAHRDVGAPGLRAIGHASVARWHQGERPEATSTPTTRRSRMKSTVGSSPLA